MHLRTGKFLYEKINFLGANIIYYFCIAVFVVCFALVVMLFCQSLLCFLEERYLTFNNSTRRSPLLANTNADGPSIDSCNESLANDDADLDEFNGNEGEARNSIRRLCAICYDAPVDCFFIPCGHCVSCYQCGTT